MQNACGRIISLIGLEDVLIQSYRQDGTIEMEVEGDVDLEGWDLPLDLLNPGLPHNGGAGVGVSGARFIHQVQPHMTSLRFCCAFVCTTPVYFSLLCCVCAQI